MPDQDNSFAAQSIPELHNKAPKAPGIMPKSAQTWTVVAIATVMILVIAFSSTGIPGPRAKAATSERQSASPPNQRQVDQYRAMVDEEARKLALERQRLDQAKINAQNAAAGVQAGSAPGLGPAATYEVDPANRGASGRREQSPEETQRATLEAERRRREYTSLFSSNVSLSFRKDQGPGRGTAATQSADQEAGLGPLLQGIHAQLSGPEQSAANPIASGSVSQQKQIVTELPHADSKDVARPNRGDGLGEETLPTDKARVNPGTKDPTIEAADGQQYRLFEGTILETILTNRLNGSFSGPVNCMVTTNAFSHDHQHLLIPQGSRVLGEVQRVSSFGQQRLAVFFHRLIMPDGYSVNLDRFHGLNQVGETGLRDQVDHHYLETFGVSLAIGAIAGIEQAGASYGYNTGGVDAYRRGASESLSQSALRILDRYLNLLPTFTVREGHRVKVYLSDDLSLPAYDHHRMPANL